MDKVILAQTISHCMGDLTNKAAAKEIGIDLRTLRKILNKEGTDSYSVICKIVKWLGYQEAIDLFEDIPNIVLKEPPRRHNIDSTNTKPLIEESSTSVERVNTLRTESGVLEATKGDPEEVFYAESTTLSFDTPLREEDLLVASIESVHKKLEEKSSSKLVLNKDEWEDMTIDQAKEYWTNYNDALKYMNKKWGDSLFKVIDTPQEKAQISSDKALNNRWATIERIINTYGFLPKRYQPTEEEIWNQVDKEQRLLSFLDRPFVYQIAKCALVENNTPPQTLEIWKKLSASEQAEVMLYTPESEKQHKLRQNKKPLMKRVEDGENLAEIVKNESLRPPREWAPTLEQESSKTGEDSYTQARIDLYKKEAANALIPPLERDYSHDYSRTEGLHSSDEDAAEFQKEMIISVARP